MRKSYIRKGKNNETLQELRRADGGWRRLLHQMRRAAGNAGPAVRTGAGCSFFQFTKCYPGSGNVSECAVCCCATYSDLFCDVDAHSAPGLFIFACCCCQLDLGKKTYISPIGTRLCQLFFVWRKAEAFRIPYQEIENICEKNGAEGVFLTVQGKTRQILIERGAEAEELIYQRKF